MTGKRTMEGMILDLLITLMIISLGLTPAFSIPVALYLILISIVFARVVYFSDGKDI